ncbi:MAG: SDR family oxidoreductase [Polyangiaceae bacterium]|nr:SDR family oxidoreductase [Polyangiaceae bacterium]
MSRVSVEDLRRCKEILETLLDDPTTTASLPEEERRALIIAAGRLSRPTRHESKRVYKAFRVVKRKAEQHEDRQARAQTEIRAARRSEVYVAPARIVGGTEAPRLASSVGPASASENAGDAPKVDATPPQGQELRTPRDCYVCKTEFRRLHFFYDAMCASCAEYNYQKRFQTASLVGRTAVITGARVKIGYHAALMLLRAGARVIVTTRFAHDAAARFSREADFDAWGDRLQVYGLDLRHSPSVELFARYLEQTEERLDILINNAAQTVRRPPGFYQHLLEFEATPFEKLPPRLQGVLRGHDACKQALHVSPALNTGDQAPALVMGRSETGLTPGLATWVDGSPGIGIRSPALLSQVPCAYDDALSAKELFPTGRLDADLQQVDLRSMNTWRMTLAEVPTPEMVEVQLVNAVAPFILCSKLKPLMMRHPTGEKHIVNVSAMEGQFSRFTKTDKHPHTNMAKAALNMMTLTSAPDYAKSGIFMNAVDTGWVTDEDPIQLSMRKQEVHDFQPPLDIVDGAARICDPFFHGILTGEHVSGKFLKDYRSVPW